MADFLTNPVDIFFGSMPVTSTAPASCLAIEASGHHQPTDRNRSVEEDPPTHS
jgi:hypothetical protein